MRTLSVVVGLLVLGGVACTQAPSSTPSSTPDGRLAQVMRGILFPNSNILFDVQVNDPGAPPVKKEGDTGSASSAFASIYTGWQVVENAAVALEEAADIISKPGRLCENGKPVPLAEATFKKGVEELRAAAKATLIAAKTKNQEKVGDLTNDVAGACSTCHEVYRDKGDAGSPLRCVP